MHPRNHDLRELLNRGHHLGAHLEHVLRLRTRDVEHVAEVVARREHGPVGGHHDTATKKQLAFEVLITDENGNELIEVKQFTMRRASEQFNSELPADAADKDAGHGLRSSEGIEHRNVFSPRARCLKS